MAVLINGANVVTGDDVTRSPHFDNSTDGIYTANAYLSEVMPSSPEDPPFNVADGDFPHPEDEINTRVVRSVSPKARNSLDPSGYATLGLSYGSFTTPPYATFVLLNAADTFLQESNTGGSGETWGLVGE